MREESFKVWLVSVRGLNERTARTRFSNCKRVEAFEGDLDEQWEADELAGLIGRLTYSKKNERSGARPKHRIPIVGDVYTGTATLKNAVRLYRGFRGSEGRTNRRTEVGWPDWPPPKDDDLLELARAMAPFVRFLHPGVVYAVAEDNRRMGADWSARLEALGIDPAIYLWDGSPCSFPGVRRYAGNKEIAVFRHQAMEQDVPSQCLALDDNDYPKHLWAFVFTGKPFRKRGPDDYRLAHLFDHKRYRNRWREELNFPPGATEAILPYGMFTSAANSVYVPLAFLTPTDFSSKLRSLIQRRALQLYGNICRVVPPPLAVKPCDDPNWEIENFRWSAPVGDMDYVPDFLEFRRKRMMELIDERYASIATDKTR